MSEWNEHHSNPVTAIVGLKKNLSPSFLLLLPFYPLLSSFSLLLPSIWKAEEKKEMEIASHIGPSLPPSGPQSPAHSLLLPSRQKNKSQDPAASTYLHVRTVHTWSSFCLKANRRLTKVLFTMSKWFFFHNKWTSRSGPSCNIDTLGTKRREKICACIYICIYVCPR